AYYSDFTHFKGVKVSQFSHVIFLALKGAGVSSPHAGQFTGVLGMLIIAITPPRSTAPMPGSIPIIVIISNTPMAIKINPNNDPPDCMIILRVIFGSSTVTTSTFLLTPLSIFIHLPLFYTTLYHFI